MEAAGEPLIRNTRAQRGVRQIDVERQHRSDIQRRVGVRLQQGGHGGHFFLRRAAVSCSLSRTRYLSPSITVTSAWCSRRSSRVTIEAALGKTSFHFLNGRLVVRITDFRS